MITEKDTAFAKALVALAREHNVHGLHADWNLNSSHNFLNGDSIHYSQVSLVWGEGRHGAKTRFSISATETVNMEEEGYGRYPD